MELKNMEPIRILIEYFILTEKEEKEFKDWMKTCPVDQSGIRSGELTPGYW